MSRLKAFRADALILAGLLLLPLLLYWPVTLGGRTMVPADNLSQWQPWAGPAGAAPAEPHNHLLGDLILENYPWKRFLVNSLRAGELPLWNPYLFAGAPFLATGQHSAYYPFSLPIFGLLPLPQAYGWFTLSQLWLAGVFGYALGRALGLRRFSAALTGLVFQGCGFMLASAAVFPMILAAAIWLPLLLACIEKVVATAGAGRSLPWVALGALALGFQALAGHIEITYYSLLVMAAFAAWRLASRARARRPLLRPAVWLLALVAVGLSIGAVQLIPFVEVGRANFREGAASLEQVRGWAFPPRRALTLLMPDFYGNPADHDYRDLFSGRQTPFRLNAAGQPNPRGAGTSDWGIKNYVEGGIYLGILPLYLAGLGLWSAWRGRPERRPAVAFFGLLALVSLAFVFGTPLYALLYYGLPGINQLHSPFRWVFPLSVSVAALAGYGLDYGLNLAATPPLWRWRRGAGGLAGRLRALFTLGGRPAALTWAAGLAFWPGLLLAAGLLASRPAYPQIAPAVERLFKGLALAADAFPDARAFYSYTVEQAGLLALLLLGTGVVLRLGQTHRDLLGRPFWPLLALGLAGADLYLAGYGFNAAVEPELLAGRPALVEWLAEQEGLWRLTTFSPQGDKPLNANTPWLYDLQDVRGYDSIILKQYSRYMATIEPQAELEFNRIQPVRSLAALDSPLLDLLGVRYVVTAAEIPLPKYALVWQGPALRVYENLAAMPRAYTLPRSATAVVADPLAAMQALDPRHYALIQAGAWDGDAPAEAQSAAPGPAEVLRYSNIEVVVRAEPAEPAWLIVNDTYFSGWDAFVRPAAGGEERALPVVRVNGNFRAVALEPGAWEVRFRYSPLSFKLGALTSFMGLAILLLAGVVWLWRRVYRPARPLNAARSVAKNSLAPMGLNLFNRAIDFVFAAFYLRTLGPADAGNYATAIIIAGWFEIVSNFGLNTLLIRAVSRDKDDAGRYLLNTSALRLLTSLLAALPVLAYLLALRAAGDPLSAETAAAVALLMVGMLFSGVSQGLTGLYYAHERAEYPASVTSVTTLLKVGFGVLALLLGAGFVGLAAVSILVNLITLAVLALMSRRHFRLALPGRLDFGLQRQMLALSYPLMLNHLLAVLFFQIDVPLLNQISGSEAVGWYNSAYKWIFAFNIIPSFFTFALFPVISRQAEESPAAVRPTLRLAVKLLWLLALPLAAATSLLAPGLIGLLGGAAFLPQGAVALRILVWSIPFGWINSVTNYALIALGRERRLTWAFVVGAGFNLVANLIFMPRYSYVAAAAITIVSELVLLAWFMGMLRPALPDMGWLRLLGGALPAAAGLAAGVWLGGQLHLLAGLALGLLLYPAGLWLTGALGEEELGLLAGILPRSLLPGLGD
ncbi:MAG: oligosaccharide flippase family protein [Candidatus Promineifilaceae bacterium]